MSLPVASHARSSHLSRAANFSGCSVLPFGLLMSACWLCPACGSRCGVGGLRLVAGRFGGAGWGQGAVSCWSVR